MADSIIARHPILSEEWNYDWGLVLEGIEQVWRAIGEPRYLEYIQHNLDHFVNADGTIRGYRLDEYNVDRLNTGKALFPLYEITCDDKFRRALDSLRSQLDSQPRTRSGGFWHKRIYPDQMWLDGIYMADSFYAQYEATFPSRGSEAFDDIAHQIVLIEQHTRDPQTGLLYHAWDESKQQRWANPVTGCSPHFWGRAMGWFVMAVVDVLDHFPHDHPQRAALLGILERTVSALVDVQDQGTGLWYQVLDQGTRAGNYLEASASCMFIYAIAKGVRKGHLSQNQLEAAQKGYLGVLDRLIQIDERGLIHLNQICAVAGLGGTPYRDGSYEYYVGEKIVANDYKGVGAFLLASVEMEAL